MKNNIFKLLGKKEIQTPIFVLGTSVIVVLAEVLRELHDYRVRRYEIKNPKIHEDIKIVFLSDLHGKTYGKNNSSLIRSVKNEKPDLILIGGDMLTRGDESTDVIAFEFIKSLVHIAPVYLANGNHEQNMREYPDVFHNRYEEYKSALENEGVIWLENDGESIHFKGTDIRITGLEVPVKCFDHFKDVPLEKEEIIKRIGKADSKEYQILMAHTPVYAKEYKEWGADVVLSGHLHGGIIRLPFIGGVITPQAKLFPRYSGDMYKNGECYSVVSRGLGTHTINIRYWNMAELVSIVLKPQDEHLS